MNHDDDRSDTTKLRDERGIALVTVLLLALALSAIVAASVRISGNSELINRYHDRHSQLTSLADGGLEETRARINSTDLEVPESGYTTVEQDASVTDASGQIIPNVERTIWVGPRGDTTGQFGTFASVVVSVEDAYGNRVIRRQTLEQESFAKFAYFTDHEPSDIRFGDGDEILGPLHTNSDVRIWDCCAVFRDEVTTAGEVAEPDKGEFREGYDERVDPIQMPETEDLTKLRDQAEEGNTAFTGMTTSDSDEATTRIEFIAVDIDGDGVIREAEGFIRVYQVTSSGDADYVSAAYDYSDGLLDSPNCGHYEDAGDPTSFVTAANHPHDGHDEETAVTDDPRCFLGGAPALNGGTFAADIGPGEWLEWPGSVDSQVQSARADADYLFPISHQLNPNFKGVIYVDGDVILDGELRGRVTVAATGDIILGDDLTYNTAPGDPNRSCNEDDLMGLFAGQDVVVADNPLNAPVDHDGCGWSCSSGDMVSYDGADDPYTSNEHFHGVVLALGQFTVANYDQGATEHEACEGQDWGRGCLYLTGGVIQESRGPVGLGSGEGYLKRYDYDSCAAELPPPYFPTTGRYKRNVYYQVNPRTFDVDSIFDATS